MKESKSKRMLKNLQVKQRSSFSGISSCILYANLKLVYMIIFKAIMHITKYPYLITTQDKDFSYTYQHIGKC